MFSAFVLFSVLSAAFASDCSVSDSAKVDCGYVGIDQSGCQSKGCCWAESSSNGVPWCFYQSGASTSCFGYNVRFYL
jgi:hypothetical protein